MEEEVAYDEPGLPSAPGVAPLAREYETDSDESDLEDEGHVRKRDLSDIGGA